MAVGLCLSISAPALSECGAQVNRWPAFSEVAPSARRISVGTVRERPGFDDGHPFTTVFPVRVEEVLRGSAPEILEVSGLRSGLPLVGSHSCRRDAYLNGRTGTSSPSPSTDGSPAWPGQ